MSLLSMRPERPLPDALREILEQVAAGDGPRDVEVLASRGPGRDTPRFFGMVGVVMVLVTFGAAIAWYMDARVSTIVVAIGVGVVVAVIAAGLQMFNRGAGVGKGSHHLVVTVDHIAIMGDSGGVQWADRDELTAVSWQGGRRADRQGRLELTFEDGDVEPVHLERMPTGELRLWAETCEKARVAGST